MDRNYCVAELMEAERLAYRARCRVRCLEANLERIALKEFEQLMESLEDARRELLAAGLREAQARIALYDCEKKLSGVDSTGQP